MAHKAYIIGLILLMILPMQIAYAEQVYPSCHFELPKHISTIYSNTESAKAANINSITPQKYPYLYPNIKTILQLNSKECYEFTVKIKDEDGNVIDEYQEMPYSPYPECNIPEGEGDIARYLTQIIMYTPGESGRYTIEAYDDEGTLEAIGEIHVHDVNTIESTVSRKNICMFNGMEFNITMEMPFPIVLGESQKGIIKLRMEGNDTEYLTELSERITMTFSPRIYVHNSIEAGSVYCSETECIKEYELTASDSTFGIFYADYTPEEQPTSKYSINSKSNTVVNVDILSNVKDRIERLSEIALQNSKYYRSINDVERKEKWIEIYDKLDEASRNIGESTEAIRSGNHDAGDVINMVKVIDDSAKYIKEIIGIIQVWL